jgi:MoaA/NifB/PqqE/SkfB family radical SAM enzyme
MERIIYYINDIDKLLKDKYVHPISCEIDPSNRCMLKCKFCMYADYIGNTRDILDWEIYLSLLHSLKEGGTKSITFTGGGEPLTHPRFNDMTKYALDKGFEIGLITNGVLLDKVENKDHFTFIRVSLDAYNVEMYKQVKGVNYFDRVISNIKTALKKGATVGLSYVVYDQNCKDLFHAEKLANDLGVVYIQFKPAWINGNTFIKYTLPDGKNIIKTDRYKANDNLPCVVAGLIGIVGADGCVYFCCQYRGNRKFNLGSLYEAEFQELWKRRIHIKPDILKCPQCRYMNYAKFYKELTSWDSFIFKHRYFL